LNGRTAVLWLTVIVAPALALAADGGGGPAPQEKRPVANIARRAGAFRTVCRRLAAEGDAKKRLVFEGHDGWLFLNKELRHIGHGRFWGVDAARNAKLKNPDPLPAIVDVHGQLKKLGIELILAPVPPKAIVYADKVSKDASPLPPLDTVHQAFYAELRTQGVTVVDTTQILIGRRFVTLDAANAAAADAARKVYCRQDSHFSAVGASLVAAALKAELAKRPWYKEGPKEKLAAYGRFVEIDGNLRRHVQGDPPAKEKLMVPVVKHTTGAGKLVEDDPASPVLLMGDSHCLVFHVGTIGGEDLLAKGAGLADHLALELGFAVDVCASMGSGATAARVELYRRSRRDPKYLQTKRVVIWCFAAREFTETDPIGWKKLPVQPR
jgi:alginate O-acetyltransferase complex protein AlgJ